MTSPPTPTPAPIVEFVDAARRGDLAALHALVDWEETGRRRLQETAADLAAEVEAEVVDEAVRRGLDESRRAADDIDLVTPYLRSLLDRLGLVRATRAAPDSDGAWVVEGDDDLLVASPDATGRVVVLGWLDHR